MIRFSHKQFRRIAIVSGFIIVVTLGWYGYVSSFIVPSRGATDLSAHSPLLPSGWTTYRGDLWSVGYPKDYKIIESKDGMLSFLPTGESGSKTYFAVREEKGTLSALKIARANAGYPNPVDLTIANYPATKYTIGNHHVEYFVLVQNTLIELISDDPTNEASSMMFATFAVN